MKILTFPWNISLTEEVTILGDEEFEYYTTNSGEYKTLYTFTLGYKGKSFKLIVHSHSHYQDGEGFESVQEYMGQWVGEILGTSPLHIDSVPEVTEVTDVLTKVKVTHNLEGFDYHHFSKVDGQSFVPYEGHPVLV